MGCEICAHADEAGSWPQELLNDRGTHCRDCHRSWWSKVEAHCARCHLHFTSNAAADLHDPYCMADTETTRKRLVSARRSSRRPVFALVGRRGGEAFASYSAKGGEE